METRAMITSVGLIFTVMLFNLTNSLFSAPVNCADGTLSDIDSGTGISGALVQIKGTSYKATSGAGGAFSVCSGLTPIIEGSGNSFSIQNEGLNSLFRLYDMRGNFIIRGTKKQLMSQVQNLSNGMYIAVDQLNPTAQPLKFVVAGNLHSKPNIFAQDKFSKLGKAAAGPTIIEAEAMSFSGYEIDNAKLGGFGIVISDKSSVPVTASATSTFNGTSGIYSVELVVSLEGDAQSSIKLTIGSKTIISETYPLGKNETLHSFKVSAVQINNGDQIKIEGTSAGTAAAGAFARVDKIIISDGNDVTLVVSHPSYVLKEVAGRLGESTTINLKPRPNYGTALYPTSPDQVGANAVDCPSFPQKTIESITIRTAGYVLSNTRVNGAITIKAANVTITCVTVSGGLYALKCNAGDGCVNLTVDHSEFTRSRSASIYISGGTTRATIRNSLFGESPDGMKLDANGNLFEHNYLLCLSAGPTGHMDGLQSRMGNDNTYINNNWSSKSCSWSGNQGGGSGAFYIQHGNFNRTLVSGNYFSGAGYSVRIGGATNTNFTFINNVVEKDSYTFGPLVWRPSSSLCHHWEGNTYNDGTAWNNGNADDSDCELPR